MAKYIVRGVTKTSTLFNNDERCSFSKIKTLAYTMSENWRISGHERCFISSEMGNLKMVNQTEGNFVSILPLERVFDVVILNGLSTEYYWYDYLYFEYLRNKFHIKGEI